MISKSSDGKVEILVLNKIGDPRVDCAESPAAAVAAKDFAAGVARSSPTLHDFGAGRSLSILMKALPSLLATSISARAASSACRFWDTSSAVNGRVSN